MDPLGAVTPSVLAVRTAQFACGGSLKILGLGNRKSTNRSGPAAWESETDSSGAGACALVGPLFPEARAETGGIPGPSLLLLGRGVFVLPDWRFPAAATVSEKHSRQVS